MKLSLPLKLGIGVVLLFAAVIATCLLWTPMKIRYYVSYYHSDDAREIARGIKGLQSIGIKGVSKLEQLVSNELKHDPQKHMAMVVNVLISDKPKGVDLLTKALAGGANEAAFLAKHWAGFNEPVKDVYGDYHYPLHLAAKDGWKDAASLLIAKGAEMDAKDSDGTTPLHPAVWAGHKDLASLLIENGADVNVTVGSISITLLQEAIMQNKFDMAELLIRRGADMDAKDNQGYTSLIYATLMGRENIALLLIEKGADVNAKSNYGSMPLHLAAKGGHKDVVALLIDRGADVNAKNSSGNTPLHFTAYNGHNDTAALLIDKNADVNAKNNKNRTPLHDAAQSGRRKIILSLIKRGADVNAIDKVGMTPMNWASERKITNLLRNNGGKKIGELPEGKPVNSELQKVIDNYNETLKFIRDIEPQRKIKNGFQILETYKAERKKVVKNKIRLRKYMENHPDDSRGKELMELIDTILDLWNF
jgi:ankyrin repeat protein